MTEYTEGDRIIWEYGSGLGAGRASGEVVEAGLSKFGYDDVMRVRCDSDGEVVYIRPEDVV